ncbi:Polysaccharide deacetylase [Flavobacterium fluvii]|uniref:Polysaccharide deacetylase n=1 Tax=Flavobacterium fluvii TaxID=468056 RepID=A0A1M5HBZ3_9FLAO|nr:polysaccharide deacetylase family protein [Flavobacterium fluvii]SHG13322.1 Polysaccharide deacetylase [Flavobacterium fluvii]
MKYKLWPFLVCVLVFSFASAQTSAPLFSVAKYKSDKQCAISYTFDDGLKEHFTLVLPKFEKLGFKATFWINGNTINQGELGLQWEKPRATWSQLKTMGDHGHEISNHGWTHKKLTLCTPEELLFEIVHNDSVIEKKIGKRPTTFGYPNNSRNSEIIKIVSKNRVGTRTSEFQMGSKSTPESLSDKLESILKNGDWCVTMIHGITNGYDAFKNESILWNHLEKVKSLEDKIWVATFQDVSAYTAEQQNIKLEIQENGKKWKVVPLLTLEKSLFNIPMTMVVNKGQITKLKAKQKGKLLPSKISNDKALFDFDPNGGEITVLID